MEERNHQSQLAAPAVEPIGVPVEDRPPLPREGEPINGFPAPAAHPREPRRGTARRPRIEKGSLRLFRLFGVDVFVHWTWFIAAYFQFRQRPEIDNRPWPFHYESPAPWYVAEILTLFLIVLLHEFGHALACRSVGGRAERIYLWPLGGVAFVQPPQRPGPFLWSIVAGPMVNLLLVPLLIGLALIVWAAGMDRWCPDALAFLIMMTVVNVVMLLFNLLPIFPLDGGQILQELLWFVIGRARSLLVVTILALPAAALLGVLALGTGNYVLAVLCGLGLLASLAGLARARLLLRIRNAPRHPGFHCPACGAAPPVGDYWVCSRCTMRYDTFARRATCPRCGNHPAQTMCAECLQSRPFADWAPADQTAAPAPEPAAPRPVLSGLRPLPSVSLGERALWAAVLGGIVLAGGWVVAGRDNLVPVLVLALGGAILGTTLAEGVSRGRRARAARKQLDGTWRLVEFDGKDLTVDGAPIIRMTISGHQFAERIGHEQTAGGSFWLDPVKQPGAINIVPSIGPAAGHTCQGIYELRGTLLRVCVGRPGGPRPVTLAFEPERQELMVYRKE
jgi:uncharacterized protein (TIGR03067 family)